MRSCVKKWSRFMSCFRLPVWGADCPIHFPLRCAALWGLTRERPTKQKVSSPAQPNSTHPSPSASTNPPRPLTQWGNQGCHMSGKSLVREVRAKSAEFMYRSGKKKSNFDEFGTVYHLLYFSTLVLNGCVLQKDRQFKRKKSKKKLEE